MRIDLRMETEQKQTIIIRVRQYCSQELRTTSLITMN